MKTQFLNLGVLAISGLAIATITSCAKEPYQPDLQYVNNDTAVVAPVTTDTVENAVTIGTITWAASNVDEPGTFANHSYDDGKYYQLNDINTNPCPAGWRIPTVDEFQTLLDSENVTSKWTERNGIHGQEFTAKATGASVFFPASGYSANMITVAGGEEISGYYWSNTVLNEEYAYSLSFNAKDIFIETDNRIYGQSIRCVSGY